MTLYKYNFHDQSLINFSAISLFDIVIDVEKYPEFIPWCSAVLVKERKEGFLVVDLIINFKGLKANYISHITFCPPDVDKVGWINIKAIDGIFKHLSSNWEFIPQSKHDTTSVKFCLEFELKSKMLGCVFGLMYNNAQKKIISAFKNRAEFLMKK